MVGRAHEIERLHELIERCGALAVVGEPGIGKTALLATRAARAGGQRARGHRRRGRGRPAVRRAADRCCGRCSHQVDALPAVQRRALEGALALAPPVPADALAVHAAALDVLIAAGPGRAAAVRGRRRALARSGSAQALLFAARRLDGERVGMLLALRPADGRRLDLSGIEQLTLAGLDREAAADAAAARRGAPLPDAVVERLHSATGGNPLALLQARRTCPRTSSQGASRSQTRCRSVPPCRPASGAGWSGCRRRPAPRCCSPRRAASSRCTGSSRPRARSASGSRTSRPAEAAGLVELEPDAVRFRHPLVRAAAYADAPPPSAAPRTPRSPTIRTGARRAGHLWAAAAGRDADAAAALEAAADDARARTGYASAALAAERAAVLTAPRRSAPGGSPAPRRTGC